jgi:molybdate transport system permease protein|tara:strand:+ start:2487 stop:3152 length:666 start_codon:yes stop_codon:yes gene_type:complete
MPVEIWQISWFTILVASLATLIMMPFGIAVAWLLARWTFPGKTALETFVSLPLVLPPVATGLILLRLLARRGPVGRLLDNAGIEFLFTWKAVVLAMAVLGFPLLVRTARAGFEQVNQRYELVAQTLGASRLRVFFTVSLPLASRAVVAGILLAFSRSLGEFGATVMVAGSIPGGTRTLASGIYNYVEIGQDTNANSLLIISIILAFGAVWLSNHIARSANH